MPAMGESVTEGVVLEWAKAVGDSIEADETIVEISTDKVDAEVPAPASGTVTEILAEVGDTVTVGQVLARMTAGAAAKRAEAPAPEPASAPRRRRSTCARHRETARTPRRWPSAPPPPSASSSRACGGAAPPAASARTTCWPRPTAPPRARPPAPS